MLPEQLSKHSKHDASGDQMVAPVAYHESRIWTAGMSSDADLSFIGDSAALLVDLSGEMVF
jgi:hypothetical protein